MSAIQFLTDLIPRRFRRASTLSFIALSLLWSCSQQPTLRPQTGLTQVPAQIRVLLDKTATLDKSKNYKDLIADVEKDPSNPEPIYNLGYNHMQSALKSHALDEHDLAISYLSEALTIVPGNQSVLNALYAIYYEDTLREQPMGYENALKVFNQLPESSRNQLNPPSVARYVVETLNQQKTKQRNRQALRDILLTAIKEQPRNDVSYYQLARLYAEDRYYPMAIATLRLGLEQAPKSIDLIKYTASYYEERAESTGCNYEHTSYIQSANDYYKKAVALEPENPKYHYDLARTAMDLNLAHVSRYEMQLANELKVNPAGLMTAAQFSSIMGNHKEATALLQSALKQGYETKDSGFHEIYMNQGDWQNAAKGYAAYVKNLNKYSVYDLIKSDIIAKQAGTSPFIVNQKISLGSDWEESLFNFWNFKISDTDLKKSAKNLCEKTEYLFYSGYRDLMNNKKELAQSKFRETINQPVPRFIERPLARVFLESGK